MSLHKVSQVSSYEDRKKKKTLLCWKQKWYIIQHLSNCKVSCKWGFDGCELLDELEKRSCSSRQSDQQEFVLSMSGGKEHQENCMNIVSKYLHHKNKSSVEIQSWIQICKHHLDVRLGDKFVVISLSGLMLYFGMFLVLTLIYVNKTQKEPSIHSNVNPTPAMLNI